MLRQLNLGQKVKKGRDTVRQRLEERIFNIVSKYEDYYERSDIISYIKAIGYNLCL